MNYTESEIKERLESHKEFIRYAQDVFNKYLTANGENNYVDTDTIQFNEYNVIGIDLVKGYTKFSMPISMLWEPDLIEAINKERIKKEEEERIKREQAEEAKRLSEEKKDRAEYERLKEKFEGSMKQLYAYDDNGLVYIWQKPVENRRVVLKNLYCDWANNPYYDQNRPKQMNNIQKIQVVIDDDT